MIEFQEERFLDYINDRRNARGLSWKEVGEKTGLKNRSLWGLYRQRRKRLLAINEMLTLADFFDVNLPAFQNSTVDSKEQPG